MRSQNETKFGSGAIRFPHGHFGRLIGFWLGFALSTMAFGATRRNIVVGSRAALASGESAPHGNAAQHCSCFSGTICSDVAIPRPSNSFSNDLAALILEDAIHRIKKTAFMQRPRPSGSYSPGTACAPFAIAGTACRQRRLRRVYPVPRRGWPCANWRHRTA